MKLTDLLSGTRILAQTNSKFNGDIQVIKDFTFGTYIKVDGLTQSGGILAKIWKETLKKILVKKPVASNILILGLGGGSAAKLVRQYWVTANITGIDIDEKMVNLGKKYLGLSKTNVNIEITDAFQFIQKENKKYDLILIDLYCGDKFPEKFEDEEFIGNVKKLMNKDGITIFNRLYGTNNRSSSMRFGRRLEKYFKKVDYMFPQANVELICYN
jgi:spermidine synthase